MIFHHPSTSQPDRRKQTAQWGRWNLLLLCYRVAIHGGCKNRMIRVNEPDGICIGNTEKSYVHIALWMIVFESGTLRIIYVFAIVLRQTTTGPEGGWQGMAQNGPMLDRTPIILTLEGCACSMRVVGSGYLKPVCRFTVTATMKEHDTHTHTIELQLPWAVGSFRFCEILAWKQGGHKTWATCAHTALLNVDLSHLIICITRCYQFGRASQLYIIHCTVLSPQPNCLAWNVSPFSLLGWLGLGQDLILVPSTSPPSLMPWSRSCRFVEKHHGASHCMASKGSAMVICCNMLKYECYTSMAPYVYMYDACMYEHVHAFRVRVFVCSYLRLLNQNRTVESLMTDLVQYKHTSYHHIQNLINVRWCHLKRIP